MELLVTAAVLAVLALLGVSVLGPSVIAGRQAASTNNLRMLAVANLTYAADHGTFCPATDPRNLVRWHGSRSGTRERFDPTTGMLSEYLGDGRQVIACPQFRKLTGDSGSWELGSGGYGYNATYLGGTPANPFRPSRPANVPNPAGTLMFATTALAKEGGLQEYPFAEPYQWVDPNGKLQGSLQPSVHFRFNGRALIAWCDGHITAELPESVPDTNYYGGDNEAHIIGFPGPDEENGYWNPHRHPAPTR